MKFVKIEILNCWYNTKD